MSSQSDLADLRTRQGAGARYPAVGAPLDNLMLAHRGTAYFLRLLNGLMDEALVDDRARVVASISYQARGFARLLEGARTGRASAGHDSLQALNEDIIRATSLPAHALRGLFTHSAIHLDVEWRDLPGPMWSADLIRWDGSRIAVSQTPLVRARLIWQAALDLDAGGRITDLPPLLRGKTGFK